MKQGPPATKKEKKRRGGIATLSPGLEGKDEGVKEKHNQATCYPLV